MYTLMKHKRKTFVLTFVFQGRRKRLKAVVVLSRCWLNGILNALVWLKMVTTKGYSQLCSLILKNMTFFKHWSYVTMVVQISSFWWRPAAKPVPLLEITDNQTAHRHPVPCDKRPGILMSGNPYSVPSTLASTSMSKPQDGTKVWS